MEKIVIRDNNARMRAAAHLAPIGFLFLSIPLAALLILFYGLEAASTGDLPVLPQILITIFVELLLLVIALWYVDGFKKIPTLIGLENFALKPFLLGPIIGLIFFAGLFILETLFKYFGVDVGDSDTSSLFADLSGVQKIIVLFVFVSFVVPICEELLFRGYILGFILHGYSAEGKSIKTKVVIWAIFYSSFLFAIAHFQGISQPIDFVVLLWTFLFACASSILRIKTKSLYPSMAAHSFYNLCSAIALMFM